MSLARTYPSLRSRIVASRAGQVTIPAGMSGVRPPAVQSYTERYRGTEYESHVTLPAPAAEPRVSSGRRFVLVSGSAVATVLIAASLVVQGSAG